MRHRMLIVAFVAVAGAAGCMATEGTPATAPSAPAAATTATSAATSSAMGRTVTETVATTTDRLGEVRAIFEDLEQRRLEAILTGDVEAFRTLFADEAFLEASMPELELASVGDPGAFTTLDVELRHDGSGCIAARITRDYTRAIVGGGRGSAVYVIEDAGGRWGLSWVGEGWECDGPHPLSS